MKRRIVATKITYTLEDAKRDIFSDRRIATIYSRMTRVKPDMVISWLDGVLFTLGLISPDTSAVEGLEKVYQYMLMTSVEETLDELSKIKSK